MLDVKVVWVTTRLPRDGDPGAAEPGFYSVEGDTLTMRNQDGKPLGKSIKLQPDDDPHVIAGRLTRERWLKARGESDFNRKIYYPPTGWR